MAVLHSILGDERDRASFNLTPVPPSPEGPNHAYDLAIRSGKDRFERRYHVGDWQLGHRIMLRFAAAFIQAAAVPPQTLPARNITKSGIPQLDQPLSIFVDHYWLQACLELTCYREELYVTVHLWVETRWLERSERSPGFPECVYCVLQIGPEEADVFGRALVSECLAAAQARVDLGLAISDDYAYLGLPLPEWTDSDESE